MSDLWFISVSFDLVLVSIATGAVPRGTVSYDDCHLLLELPTERLLKRIGQPKMKLEIESVNFNRCVSRDDLSLIVA